MKTKYRKSVVFVMAVSLLLLSAECALAITDLGTLPGGSGPAAMGANNQGQAPRFISNTILVKFTAQARANLKDAGEDVNPAATGRPSLDVICRDHAGRCCPSSSNATPHRPPVPARNPR